MPEAAAVPCPACNLLCDDLVVQIDGEAVRPVRNGCARAGEWFEALNAARPPVAELQGRECTLEDAVAAAAQILADSRAPLIYGLSRSSTPGQRLAVELADRLGGILDTTASVGSAPATLAFQQVGESSCTLGEVRDRSDLVLFWQVDPQVTHPRLMERFIDSPGRFVPAGRKDRTVIVIHDSLTETDASADVVLRVPRDRQFDLIAALRRLTQQPDAKLTGDFGIPHADVADLAKRMAACHYGALFHGLSDPADPISPLAIEGLLRLVSDLNDHTRFTMRSLGTTRAGAESVVCWQTGFPFAVDFGRSFPRYSPGENSAPNLLERGEVDCCLIVGSESLSKFSDRALETLSRIPTVVLDNPQVSAPFTPKVRFTTAVYGLFAAGTASRLDDVPLPLRKLADGRYPADHEILVRIRDLLMQERAGDHQAGS